jgi:hypothetical protein
MTRAIGRPATNAPTIANANAESKFASGRTLPANMPGFSTAELKKSRRRDEAVADFDTHASLA